MTDDVRPKIEMTTDPVMPSQESVTAFFNYIMPDSTNGRLASDKMDHVWAFIKRPEPANNASLGQIKTWRERVRSGILQREEMIKGLPAAVKERARVAVYDRIFGWILDVESDYVKTQRVNPKVRF